jgi:hypothetical protein
MERKELPGTEACPPRREYPCGLSSVFDNFLQPMRLCGFKANISRIQVMREARLRRSKGPRQGSDILPGCLHPRPLEGFGCEHPSTFPDPCRGRIGRGGMQSPGLATRGYPIRPLQGRSFLVWDASSGGARTPGYPPGPLPRGPLSETRRKGLRRSPGG